MNDRSTLLLEHHLKELKLPSFLREYGKMAAQCAAEGVDHPQYLLRLSELELIDRHQRMVERRIRAARFPAVKSLDTLDFPAIPSLNKALVMELARCEYIQRRENIIAVGNSGTGKTHMALGLGLSACQRGMSVGFTTAAALVHEMMEARDERRLLNLQRQLSRLNLLIIDELGFVPLSRTGAELLFEVFSQRYEQGSILVTTNLPFDEWTEVFGSERLTGALLDRLTHHVHILEMNGESYRLKPSTTVAGGWRGVFCNGRGDQRQLVLPVGDDYFCRSPRVIIRYRRCRIGYRSASRNTEAETNGRKDATDGGGNGGDERALGPQVAVRPVAVGDQD